MYLDYFPWLLDYFNTIYMKMKNRYIKITFFNLNFKSFSVKTDSYVHGNQS